MKPRIMKPRILAAAAALRHFTAAELVAYSGCHEETVRSVLARNRGLFESVGREGTTGRGRPAERFRVRDLDDLRAVLSADTAASITHGPEPAAEVGLDRLAAEDSLILAEEAVLKAAAVKGDIAKALVETASNDLDIARQRMDDVVAARRSRLQARADALEELIGMAQVVRIDEEQPAERLQRTAQAIAEAVVAGKTHAWRFVEGLASLLVDTEYLPPARILTRPGTTPNRVLTAAGPNAWLVLDSTRWIAKQVAGGDGVVWSQEWAKALADRGLLVSLVVPYDGEDRELLERTVSDANDLAADPVVVSRDSDPDLPKLVTECGGRFVSDAERDTLAWVLSKSVRRQARVVARAVPGFDDGPGIGRLDAAAADRTRQFIAATTADGGPQEGLPRPTRVVSTRDEETLAIAVGEGQLDVQRWESASAVEPLADLPRLDWTRSAL